MLLPVDVFVLAALVVVGVVVIVVARRPERCSVVGVLGSLAMPLVFALAGRDDTLGAGGCIAVVTGVLVLLGMWIHRVERSPRQRDARDRPRPARPHCSARGFASSDSRVAAPRKNPPSP